MKQPILYPVVLIFIILFYTVSISFAGYLPITDDFHPWKVTNSFWRFVDPRGDCTQTMTGTHAEIGIPDKQSHAAWPPANNAPRLLQSVPDGDFAVEAKFDSVPSVTYQMQGIMVLQTNDVYFRFEIFGSGGSQYLYCGYISNNYTHHHLYEELGFAPPYLRVARTNDTWTYSYSTNRLDWVIGKSFTRAITVNDIGIYGATEPSNPAFTARADYFMNLSYPLLENVLAINEPTGITTTSISEVHSFYCENTTSGGTFQTGYGLTKDGSGWTWVDAAPTNTTGILFGATNSISFPRPGKYYYGARWLAYSNTWYSWDKTCQTNAHFMAAVYHALVLSSATNILTRWTFDTPGDTSPSEGSGSFTWNNTLTTNWPGDGTIAFDGYTATGINRYCTFRVSTFPNYVDIGFNIVSKRTASGPETLLIQYSTNGNTFIYFDSVSLPLSDTWYTNQFDLSNILLLSQNPNAAFRLIGTNATGSVLYLDDVSVSYAFPEPAVIIVFGIHLLITLRQKQ